MCKSHNFLMISNCDFLSSDIVLSKSASSGLSSVDGLRVRLQMSSFSHLPSLPRTARLPGPALSQLFIFGWRWKCREIQEPLATT